uniref:Uncharacterized protein n=1 Tax=Micrurus corallinus TaxID=54390 RepID=A0A2D4FGQ2_MICCO
MQERRVGLLTKAETFASCPPSVASARRCSHAFSTMFPLINVSGSSTAAVVATRTILIPKTSVSEPADSPKGAPNCWLEQKWENHQIGLPTQLLSWSPDSAAEMGQG